MNQSENDPNRKTEEYSWDWCIDCPRENKCMLNLTFEQCQEISKNVRDAVLDDIETVIDKTTSYVSRYELERKIAELRQAGEPQYQCGNNCKGECSGEVDGVVHCPYNPQAEQKKVLNSLEMDTNYSWDWCLGCPRNDLCMLNLTFEQCQEIFQREKQVERDTVLDEICEWLRCNNPQGLYHHIKNNMRGGTMNRQSKDGEL